METGLGEESPEMEPLPTDEPEEFEVTKKMTFTGNFKVTFEPLDGTEEEVTEEETGSTTEPLDEFDMNGDSKGFFSDSITVQLDSEVFEDTPEGLKIPNVTIAKSMVQTYHDSKGRARRVLKSADALRKMVEFASGRPVTDEHPEGGVVMSRKDTRGYIDNLYVTENDEVKSDLYVTCKKLAKLVRDGKKREVSIGFYSGIDTTPGVFNDQEYDEIQNDIWLDHVAIVKNGRCSRKDGCGITDSVKSKVKVVKVKATPVVPATITDSPEVVYEKTKILNQIHLVADSELDTDRLMKMDRSDLELIRDMIVSTKGPAFNIDNVGKDETIDDLFDKWSKE